MIVLILFVVEMKKTMCFSVIFCAHKGQISLSEKKIMSNTYLNKLPCRNYLEKPGNKNALDNKAFFVIIKL